MKPLESKRDEEGNETRPVYDIARGDMDEATQPIGWAVNPSQAARLINKSLSESTGTLDRIRGAELYWSKPLRAWFVEE